MKASCRPAAGRELYFDAQCFRSLVGVYAKQMCHDWHSLHWSALRVAFRYWIMCRLWETAYATPSRGHPLLLADVITITLLGVVFGQARSSLVPAMFARRSDQGNVSYELAKPAAIPLSIAAAYAGVMMPQFAAVIAYLIGCVWLSRPPLVAPAAELTGLFFVSAALALLLAATFTICLSFLSLRLRTAFYVDWLSSAAFQLFSGAIVPLAFFPAGLRHVGSVLPFRFMAYEPMTIYLAKVDAAGAHRVILVQGLWLVALGAIAFILWKWILAGLQRNGE